MIQGRSHQGWFGEPLRICLNLEAVWSHLAPSRGLQGRAAQGHMAAGSVSPSACPFATRTTKWSVHGTHLGGVVQPVGLQEAFVLAITTVYIHSCVSSGRADSFCRPSSSVLISTWSAMPHRTATEITAPPHVWFDGLSAHSSECSAVSVPRSQTQRRGELRIPTSFTN